MDRQSFFHFLLSSRIEITEDGLMLISGAKTDLLSRLGARRLQKSTDPSVCSSPINQRAVLLFLPCAHQWAGSNFGGGRKYRAPTTIDRQSIKTIGQLCPVIITELRADRNNFRLFTSKPERRHIIAQKWFQYNNKAGHRTRAIKLHSLLMH